MDTADADAENDADAVFVHLLQIPAAVLNGFHCSHESVLLVKVHLAGFLAVDELSCVEILHLAGEGSLELRGIEVCDRAGAADAFLNIFPSFGHRVAHGCQSTKAGNDHSFQFHNS